MNSIILLVIVLIASVLVKGQYGRDITKLSDDDINLRGISDEEISHLRYFPRNDVATNAKVSRKVRDAKVGGEVYSYTDPGGVVYTINYIVDENWFNKDRPHLPTPPAPILP